MKNSRRRLKIFVNQIHTAKSIILKDIDTTASIHKHLCKLVSSHLRSNHQSQLTRIVNPGRVILTAPYDRLLTPPQISRNLRLNRVHYPLMNFLISFAQNCGEHMTLTTIQLFWIALITRMLLLIPLARLLIKTTLIALALETRA